jgi:hypothetical protein
MVVPHQVAIAHLDRLALEEMRPGQEAGDVYGVEKAAISQQFGANALIRPEAERSIRDNMKVPVPQVTHIGYERPICSVDQKLPNVGTLLHAFRGVVTIAMDLVTGHSESRLEGLPPRVHGHTHVMTSARPRTQYIQELRT